MSEKLDALAELEKELKKLISTPMGRRTFVAATPFLLSACATPQQHRHREGDNRGQEVTLTVEQEREMTKQYLEKMKKDYPPVQDPEMQRYIASLGSRIAQSSGAEGNPYHYNFTVVGVNYVNAFALPAGTVFVTAPLIEMADSEAELAGVVGHEIGHIKARHTAERLHKAEQEKKKSLFYGLGGGLLGGAAGFGLGKLLCDQGDKKCLTRAAAIGAAAGAAGGLLIQKYSFMANSREDEMEADRIGFRTSVAAGFHKDHVGRFYTKLLAMEKEAKRAQTPILGSLADALSTHPPSEERVQQMREMAARQSQGRNSRVSSRQFDRIRRKASTWVKAHKKS